MSLSSFRGRHFSAALVLAMALAGLPASGAASTSPATRATGDLSVIDHSGSDAGRPAIAPHQLDLQSTAMRPGPPATVDFRRLAAASPASTSAPVEPYLVPDPAAYFRAKDAVDAQRSASRKQAGPAVAPLGPQLGPTDLEQEQTFGGLTQNGSSPADTILAASPGFVVEEVNLFIKIFPRNGGAPQQATLPAFFKTGLGFLTDPRIAWDAGAQRWYSTILGCPAACDGTNTSSVLLAVSKTADPTGVWDVWQAMTDANKIDDQPRLGYSADKIVVAVDQFNSLTSFNADFMAVIQKSDVLAAVSPQTVKFNMTSGLNHRTGIIPATPLPNENTNTVFAPYHGSDTLGQYASTLTVTGTPAGNNVVIKEQGPGISDLSTPPSAIQPGVNSMTIDTGDNRFVSAVFSKKGLWITANDKCNGPVACIRIIHVDVSGVTFAVNDDADIVALGSSGDVYYGAVSVECSAKHLMVTYTQSSSTMFPTSRIEVLAIPVIIGSGLSALSYGAGNVPYVGPQVDKNHPTVARFGDYSGMAADGAPCSESFWGATMNGGFGGGGLWATNIVEVTMQPPTVTSITPSSGPWATTVDIFGNFFTSDSFVTFGAKPATSVKFIDSTHLQATAPTHPPGTVDVTVTTPKGMAPTSVADHYTYPPAAYVANSGSDNLDYVDMSSLGPLPIPVGTGPVAVRVTNDASTVYSADQGAGTVTPVDTYLQLARAPFTVGSSPTDLVVSPSGSTLYVADSGSMDVRVVNTANGHTKVTIPFGSAPDKLAITPDGSRVLVTFPGANDVLSIDTSTNTVEPFVYSVSKPSAIAASPDGQSAWVTSLEPGSCFVGLLGSLTQLNLASHTVGGSVTIGCHPLGVVASPDGSTVWVSNSKDDSVQSVSALTLAADSPIALQAGASPRGVAISPEGATLLVAESGRDRLGLVDTASKTLLPDVPVDSHPVAVDVTHLNADPCAGQVVKPRAGFLPANLTGGATTDELLNVQYCPLPGHGPLAVKIRTAVTVPTGCPAVVIATTSATLQQGENPENKVLTAPTCAGTYTFRVTVVAGVAKYPVKATLKVT